MEEGKCITVFRCTELYENRECYVNDKFNYLIIIQMDEQAFYLRGTNW